MMDTELLEKYQLSDRHPEDICQKQWPFRKT